MTYSRCLLTMIVIVSFPDAHSLIWLIFDLMVVYKYCHYKRTQYTSTKKVDLKLR